MKEEDIADTISSSSGAAEPKTGPEVEVLQSAMKIYCSIRHTSCNDLGDEYKIETGSVLAEKVNPVLADRP